jgi:enhancing lycopene biosynthesis protein 2
MTTSIAVLLSGSGVYDGSEIHEAVLTLLAIEQQGASYQCFAPDVAQMHVIDHRNGDVAGESRNVLTESARIDRGKVQSLENYNAGDYDALVLPGGFGAAKNLCTFATEGATCTIDTEVERAIVETHKAGKPIGAMCIAPVMLAKLIPGVEITLGGESDASAAASEMGAVVRTTSHGEVIVDDKHSVATTPSYMLDDATLPDIMSCATNLLQAVLKMTAKS